MSRRPSGEGDPNVSKNFAETNGGLKYPKSEEESDRFIAEHKDELKQFSRDLTAMPTKHRAVLEAMHTRYYGLDLGEELEKAGVKFELDEYGLPDTSELEREAFDALKQKGYEEAEAKIFLDVLHDVP
ncbi:MAG: hypothetical protein A2751_05100 [Candidatus Doudnabacteria bacterium RIFCSPHIGHO2_01_FULL_46_14]|uniref:Uncharacterized protein n=1 Tax=Candidatus Doudnabacteria bacterium RIFCSPHIGHO2_01_FULL_46_14 TaxID=1817824 RepID=A0A1F5NNR8_9BACT|nr:MAG: hypothetical protein A2751_05100 [Candidatus Doudnabacteria bacterium RIFCSPHIGHO2_01_FULL_46_14]